LVREIVQERKQPNVEDIEEISTWNLNQPAPVRVQLKDLLLGPSNLDAVARTPADVVNKINDQWGTNVKPGKVWDLNPGRYQEYAAKYPGSSAKPSVMVDGEIVFGVGRFIAALLRGDETLMVWDLVRR
jgi:hypothetical protein